MKQSININKVSKRGGQRNVKPRKLSTSRVLDYLFKQYGGTFKLAEDLGIYSQMVSKWISQGYVPMKWVGPVSRLLKHNQFLLNYEGMVLLTAKHLEWSSLVICNIEPHASEKILSAKHPKTPEEILG